ncbi:MAG TPA: 30S ribosomal protein S20 [Egibacteraceae bacterium]|nr:30S ribosomal protein S20 [Egibacteraceae bacterium]
MANIASQIKRNRQALVRRQRNKAVRSALKTHLKKFLVAADSGDKEAAAAAYQAAARQLDKAAGKGVVHANFAANHKSKMAKRLGAL